MNKEIINSNFDINAKCQSMIEQANKIIKVYLETSNLYEDDGRYSLAYDVKNYLPKLQQENKQLKEQNKKEFADYTKFKQEQYDEYLEKSNKLIKGKQHYKHIIDELEKWLEERIDMCFTTIPDYEIYITRQEEKHILQEVLNKLQELKGSDKE